MPAGKSKPKRAAEAPKPIGRPRKVRQPIASVTRALNKRDRAIAAYRKSQDDFADALIQAQRDGHSLHDIAATCGLSHQRVAEIIAKRDAG